MQQTIARLLDFSAENAIMHANTYFHSFNTGYSLPANNDSLKSRTNMEKQGIEAENQLYYSYERDSVYLIMSIAQGD